MLCTRMAVRGAGRPLPSDGATECCGDSSNDCTDDASESRWALAATAGARSWGLAAGGGTATCLTALRVGSGASSLAGSGASALGAALGDVLGESPLGASDMRLGRGICETAAGVSTGTGLRNAQQAPRTDRAQTALEPVLVFAPLTASARRVGIAFMSV